MGGGGKIDIKIPDWKHYKVEGIPSLEWTQRALAAKGLKDPWLRNEVWRYQQWPGFAKSAMITVTRGLKWAAIAMAATVFLDKSLDLGLGGQRYMKGHSHGDHH